MEPYRAEGCDGCSWIVQSSVDGPARDRGPWPGMVAGLCSRFADGLRLLWRLSVRIRSHFAEQAAAGGSGRMRKCADDGYDEGEDASWRRWNQSGSESGNGNESGRRGLGTGVGPGSEIENESESERAGGCEIGCSWHQLQFQWAWLVQALLGRLKRRKREKKRELEPDLNEMTELNECGQVLVVMHLPWRQKPFLCPWLLCCAVLC